MRFGVLGPLSVQADDGTAVAIGSPNQRLVLAILLAHQGGAVSADVLIDALWGEEPPPSASQSLRTYVSRLRHVVGDRLVSRGGSYALDVTGDEVDCTSFERLLESAAGLSPPDAVAAHRSALALWRGEPFADLERADGFEGIQRRLHELRSAAREQLAVAALDAGDVVAAAAEAEQLVAVEPLREGAWTVLVRALVAAKRPGDALRAYQRAVAALADAGLTPSATLRDAEALALSDRAEPAGAVARTSRVPVPPLSLIGREDEVAEANRLLGVAGLVTLHGPGGVGKTRIAQEVAVNGSSRYRLGVRFVELAPVTDAGAVPAAVVDALGLARPSGSVSEALARAHALDVLVVLDNCEHVLDAVAETLLLMRANPGPLTILATSRERIGVPGEYSLTVAPLATSGPDNPAQRLFVDRALAHAPGLIVKPESLAIIDRIVQSVDGLPLAIEMAAARLEGLGLRDLDALLADRLDVLRSTERLGDARHRTLDAVIEWSEQLLDERERAVLRRLAVFAGDVRAGDITAVLDDPDAMLTVGDLVARSLVVADHRPGRSTYGLLGMIRRRGRDQLRDAGEDAALQRRHAAHVADVARDANSELRGEGEAGASALFDLLFDELRTAHAWARRADPDTAVSLSASLHTYAVSRQREEALQWAAELEPLLGDGPDTAVVMASVAFRANNLGRFAEAEAAAERGIELAAGRPEARFALDAYVDAALYQGQLELALGRAHLLLAASEAAGDAYMIALGTSGLVLSHAYAGRIDEALAALSGAGGPTPFGPSARGWLAYSEGEALLNVDPDGSRVSLTRAIELADSVDHRFLAGVARVSLASLLGRTGEPMEALAAFADIVTHWRRRGDRTHQLTTLRNLVCLFHRVDAHDDAAELLGAVRAADDTSFGDEAARLDAVAEQVREALGHVRFDDHVARGADRDVPGAADHALEVIAGLVD